MGERWKVAALMVAAVVALAVGEAMIARGLRRQAAGDRDGSWLAAARGAVANPWVVAGAGLLGVHLVLYAAALSVADLSVVMPLTAASYPLGAVLARYFLHESVSPTRWLGTAIIAAGVALVVWGERRG